MTMQNSLIGRLCSFNKALSDPNRMKILKIIGSSGENPPSVSEIARVLGLAQPSVTAHLKILESVNVIKRLRRGSHVYCILSETALDDYRSFLDYAFENMFHPCEFEYDCDKCPVSKTCG